MTTGLLTLPPTNALSQWLLRVQRLFLPIARLAVSVKTHNTEYESGTFLRNAGKHLPIHTVQKSRRHASSTQKRACNYRGADKSLARPGRKQAYVSVRMACISFSVLPCRKKKKLDNSSRLDVVEIASVPDMLPSLFPSWWG